MKRTLLLSILGIAGSAATLALGQGQTPEPGYILLDNYSSSGPRIAYGCSLADSQFTVGLYWALGDVTTSVPFDPTAWPPGQIGSIPSTFGGYGIPGGPLALGTGRGSTVGIYTGPNLAGYFSATQLFAVPGSTPGQTITVEVIAYNGADYASSLVRFHTVPFTMPVLAATAVPPSAVGYYMFNGVIPEPSTFVLAGMGIAALLILHRREHPGLDCPDVRWRHTNPGVFQSPTHSRKS